MAILGPARFIEEGKSKYPYPIKNSTEIIRNVTRYLLCPNTRRNALIADQALATIYEWIIIFIRLRPGAWVYLEIYQK
jgi:hypothetical protein